MRRRERRRSLHVRLEVPELLKPHAANVHNIRRHGDGHVREVAVGNELGAKRRVEAGEVLVEGEEA